MAELEAPAVTVESDAKPEPPRPAEDDVRKWGYEELLRYLAPITAKLDQQSQETLKNAKIDGDTFLDKAGDVEFFKHCRLPIGPCEKLAQEALELRRTNVMTGNTWRWNMSCEEKLRSSSDFDAPDQTPPIIDYYERLYVVHEGPSLEKEMGDSLFDSLELEDFELDVQPLKRLDLVSFLALSLVREAKGDVAALHMERLPGEKLRFLICKNNFLDNDQSAREKDKLLLEDIVSLLHGVAAENIPRSEFAVQYCVVLLKHCKPKLGSVIDKVFGGRRVTMETVEIELDQLSAAELRTLSDEALQKIDPNNQDKLWYGDKLVLHLMKERKTNCATIIRVLVRSFVEMKPYALYTAKDFYKITHDALTLTTSALAKHVMSSIKGRPPYSLRQALAKLARYAHGLPQVYRAFVGCVKMKTIEYDITYYSESITLKKTPYTACIDYWKTRYDLDHPITETQLKAKLGLKADTPWPSKLTVTRHPEIALILLLRERGIHKGILGVSKHSCGVCASMILSFNSMGDWWTVTGEHSRKYLSLLTGIWWVDSRAHEIIRWALDDLLQEWNSCRSESVPQFSGVASSDLKLLEFEAKLSWDPTEGNRSRAAAAGPTENIGPRNERRDGEGQGVDAEQSSASAVRGASGGGQDLRVDTRGRSAGRGGRSERGAARARCGAPGGGRCPPGDTRGVGSAGRGGADSAVRGPSGGDRSDLGLLAFESRLSWDPAERNRLRATTAVPTENIGPSNQPRGGKGRGASAKKSADSAVRGASGGGRRPPGDTRGAGGSGRVEHGVNAKKSADSPARGASGGGASGGGASVGGRRPPWR